MRPLTAISITVSAIVLVIVSAVMMEPASSGTFPGTNGKIVFTQGSTVSVMDADGSNRTVLAGVAFEHDPSWSPDGSKIAFTSTRDGNEQIYVMDADGSSQTNISNNSENEDFPSWSPDGSKIAFRSGRDGTTNIYVMDSDGSNQTRLNSNSAN